MSEEVAESPTTTSHDHLVNEGGGGGGGGGEGLPMTSSEELTQALSPQGLPDATANMSEESAVLDFIRILGKHCRACEQAGKYLEAEVAYKRWDELWVHEESRRREELRANHIEERLNLEESHSDEMNQLAYAWEGRLSEYDAKAGELEHRMQERQEEEVQDMRSLGTSMRLKPKFSKEVLNLRCIQETLAKQKDYTSAQHVKVKADALEEEEMEKMMAKMQGSLWAREEKLRSKHRLELEALKKRTQLGRDEQMRQKNVDVERLLLRYENNKKALERMQGKQKQTLETLLIQNLGPRPASRRGPCRSESMGVGYFREMVTGCVQERPKTAPEVFGSYGGTTTSTMRGGGGGGGGAVTGKGRNGTRPGTSKKTKSIYSASLRNSVRASQELPPWRGVLDLPSYHR